jgi:hypothetical protein
MLVWLIWCSSLSIIYDGAVSKRKFNPRPKVQSTGITCVCSTQSGLTKYDLCDALTENFTQLTKRKVNFEHNVTCE